MTKKATKQQIVNAYASYLRRNRYSVSETEAAIAQVAVTLDILVQAADDAQWFWPNAATTFSKINSNSFKVSGPFAREL